MFSLVLPVSPNLYLILCWMSSSPELQLTPGWFSPEKRKQINTKSYLFKNSAHWGCVAAAKLQLSALSPARRRRSQVAFGTGLPKACRVSSATLGTLPWVCLGCKYQPSISFLPRLTTPKRNCFTSAHSLPLTHIRQLYALGTAKSSSLLAQQK